ncbi:MAG: glycine cleavage system aminomethyltransferase GcvT [Gammaproteobacteria bacterium]|nr:glycine cleavage system aminomethyltransferase GcvT [Gammaproteobacteria bacterium]
MSQQTILYDKHVQYGAKIVDFAGWQMPINYGSQMEEHKQVRTDAGMFDVSHMVVLDLEGDNVIDFLKKLLANDVSKVTNSAGKALYSCMLNERGGVIDDLIVYYLNDQWFRMVVNAATRDKDIAWISEQAKGFGVTVKEGTTLAMIAVQGPNAIQKALSVLPESCKSIASELKRFVGQPCGDWFVGRTGYTGEDGFEIMLPETEAADLWDQLAQAGVKPIGLGARDTLRLEAGMNLYGTDMDEDTSPLQAGLGWTLAMNDQRDFIGREALQAEKTAGPAMKFVGLVLQAKGVLRGHQKVLVEGIGEGEITSGTFSPSMGVAIAMARVPAQTAELVQIDMRGKLVDAKVVKLPFVRDGQVCVEI